MDKASKIALAFSVIALVLVVGGALAAYFTVKNLVSTQVDNFIKVLADLKTKKFSVPIHVDRVVDIPIKLKAPINISTTVDIPINESLTAPVNISQRLEIPINLSDLMSNVVSVVTLNTSLITRSNITLNNEVQEIEIPIQMVGEFPVMLNASGVYVASTDVRIVGSIPLNISKLVKVPINKSVDLMFDEVVKIPVKIDMVLELSLKDLGLEGLVDQIIATLRSLRI